VLIGVFIGLEIILKDIKKSGKEIVISAIFESLGTYFLVAGAFFIYLLIVNAFTGSFVEILLIALYFGSIALATAPVSSAVQVQGGEGGFRSPYRKTTMRNFYPCGFPVFLS